jgi:hypothetical protein
VVIGLWTRRTILTLGAILPVIALLNVIGQQPSDSRTEAAAATVQLSAPRTVRGGLLFQSRLRIDASQTIDHLRLVLDDGWLEGMQISSVEPQPTAESFRDGRVVFSYGRLREGDRLVVWIQSQVDPTNPGRHKYGLTLQDATTDIARLNREITILP